MLGLRFETLRDRSIGYWLLALIAIIGGMALTAHLEESYAWIETRYTLYRPFEKLSDKKPKHTVLVLVTDDEYWIGPFARRAPLRRDKLAEVIEALDACNPSVIAVDIDLSSPTIDGSKVDNEEYAGETKKLVDTVLAVSKKRTVILAAGITAQPGPGAPYTIDPSVYGQLPFSNRLRRGYINLPYDVRQVPDPQPVSTGEVLDSFATAVVRATHENVLYAVSRSDVLPYATFIKENFPSLTTTDVLKGQCGSIASNIAIIGGAWHQSAYNAGDQIDTHYTPNGLLSGAVIHANYIEALIDERTRPPLPKTAGRIIEFIISAAFAIFLAIKTKRGFEKLILVFICCIILFLASYVAWQNAGYYFDFFFPASLLLLHSFGHYFHELWSLARIGRSHKLTKTKEGRGQ